MLPPGVSRASSSATLFPRIAEAAVPAVTAVKVGLPAAFNTGAVFTVSDATSFERLNAEAPPRAERLARVPFTPLVRSHAANPRVTFPAKRAFGKKRIRV